ncbi:hypothetical protein WOLCODRAFT_103389 [Wolfiporia cocos MD-104 SS10]|uniref:Uncharacterized protein n=1 Tax=Wolfiporia cocos (strain MD-104) TaxID=742152 RepID=A0A2H3JM91_WOLCO|nr:hypothetical protein WOLCODRAFT_103389 [Wolfiporia cocos MD-104 SS10]
MSSTTAIANGVHPPAGDNQSAWPQRLSASFSSIAEQISAASAALAALDVAVSAPAVAGGDTDVARLVAGLSSRLDGIERTQVQLGQELDAVRGQVERLQGHEQEHGREHETITVIEEPREGVEPEPDLRVIVAELQKKVEGIQETVRLNQAQLYARLQNAVIINKKSAVKPLVMADGKTPSNFPGTKGEFENMTKERYEYLLKSYGQPIKGDTLAKREAVREFLGLPPPSDK